MKLNIYQFKGYDAEAFKEYFSLHLTGNYNKWQLILPTSWWCPEYPNQAIVQQYYSAMYIGEKLAQLAKCFGYSVPTPYREGEFVFTIKSTKKKIPAIAAILAQATQGYMASEVSPVWEQFQEQAGDFFVAVNKPKGITPVCIGIFAICYRFCDDPNE